MTKYQAFLEDLKKVYEKHGLYIDGCGCCGSPYVEEIGPMECAINSAEAIDQLSGDGLDSKFFVDEG